MPIPQEVFKELEISWKKWYVPVFRIPHVSVLNVISSNVRNNSKYWQINNVFFGMSTKINQ